MDTTIPYGSESDVARASRTFSLARRAGFATLWVLGGLLITLTVLPVLLLFMATAVPLYIALVLAALDVGLIVALFRFDRAPFLVGAVILGITVMSGFAIWLSQVYATTPPITDAKGRTFPVASRHWRK